jgi:hypothetical protein
MSAEELFERDEEARRNTRAMEYIRKNAALTQECKSQHSSGGNEGSVFVFKERLAPEELDGFSPLTVGISTEQIKDQREHPCENSITNWPNGGPLFRPQKNM